MKFKAGTSVTLWARFSFALGAIVFVLYAFVPLGNARGQQPLSSAIAISARAKTFLSERWNRASFTEGMAIVADTKETPPSRAAAIEVLHANRRKLTANEMRSFLGEVTQLARDVSLDETNAAFAVSVMANLALTMRDQGQLSDSESKQQSEFLIATATDLSRGVHLRSSAITSLGILKITEAAETLRGLLTDSASANVPEIARPVCLSLMRIDGDQAIPELVNVLKRTGDSRVFGTAAFALGQLKKRESMTALVANASRFPESGSCEAALVDMEEVIYDVLKDPQTENQNWVAAIQATRYLWREGQRETYTPLLRNLLSNAPLPVRKAAAERLLESASCLNFESEKRELTLVLATIGNQAELLEYRDRIESRLSAGVATPAIDNTVKVPTVLEGSSQR